MIIVFRASEKLKEKMVEYYKDKRRANNPPYSIFQADDADTTVTLYESGKVMFQGASADVDAKMWAEIERNLTGKRINLAEGREKLELARKQRLGFIEKNIIGSDEVGVGDFFGPIVVTAAYVPKDKIDFLDKLGVRDSKIITDEKIASIYPTLIKEVPHVTYILSDKEYNDYQSKGYNMNRIKAIIHNKVLYELKMQGYEYDEIIIDQFVYKNKYYEHLKAEKDKVYDVTFLTKAESICIAVAAASCISRYIFLEELKNLSLELGMPIPKGAGENVDRTTALIVKKYGEKKLLEIAKCNFRNIEKYKQY